MAFLRIRFPGMWGVGSVVSAAEFEAIDAMRPDAIDGGAGGTYAPSALLSIGGLAVTLNPTTLTLSATAMAVSAPGTWTAAQTINANVALTGTLSGTISLSATTTLSATQPAKNADPGGNNRLYSTNTAKAWAKITTDGAGSYTIDDGYNIASCTVAATYVEVTWARAFATADYAPTVTAGIPFLPNAINATIGYLSQTTAKTRIHFWDIVGAATLNPATNSVVFFLSVMGRQ